MGHVLEHVDDPNAFLAMLTSRGPTFIVVPETWDIISWIHPEHKRVYTTSGVVNNPQAIMFPLLIGGFLLYIAHK